ncbi:MAG: HEAT repeat domain-containing protein [Pirellulales bacterium]|nr:HEAT repeat domain-containing protein [Pirellulales bacterium]
MNNTSQRLLVVPAVLAALALTIIAGQSAAQNAPPAAGDEAQLIGVLQGDAPTHDKAKACQQLAVVGTKECVPALAALLADPQLAHYARYALEPIPDPAVDEALREALGKLEGLLRVGAINSIGARRDAKAVGPLVAILGDRKDAPAAQAAAAALGSIATPEAVEVLEIQLGNLADAPASLKPALGDACLACAERLLAQGKRDDAVALYDLVRKANLPEHIVTAGLYGAILARQADGARLLAEQLGSDDPARFEVALLASRQVSAAEVTAALVAAIGPSSESRKAVLIVALGDRRDPAALPALRDAAKSGAAAVRIAAIGALGKLSDAEAVPLLIEAAVADDAGVAEAAKAALLKLPGEAVDAGLTAMLEKGEPGPRRLAIEMVGKRRVAAAVPALRKAADNADASVRMAAIESLGQTIGLEDFTALTDRIVRPGTPEEMKVVRGALRTACLRTPDRDACAERLLAPMAEAPVPGQCELLHLLGTVGGPKALVAVTARTKDTNDAIRDAATQALGRWMTPDAAPALLELAKSDLGEKYQVRALRGYIRIARQLNLPPAERLAMCREALAAAQRDDERRLVLGVLPRIPSAEALSLAVDSLGAPALKDAAGVAAVAIAGKLVDAHPAEVAQAMRRVVDAGLDDNVTNQAKTLLEKVAKKTE